MKLNKKAAVFAIATLIIGGQVFASSNLAGTFEDVFTNWTAAKLAIKEKGLNKDLAKHSDDNAKKNKADADKEADLILNELAEQFEQQKEQSKDIDELLSSYQSAIAAEQENQSAKIKNEFISIKKNLEDTTQSLSNDFDAKTIAPIKQNLSDEKDKKISAIKEVMNNKTAESTQALNKTVEEARKALEDELKVASQETKKEILAEFDAQIEELIASISPLKEEYTDELITATEEAVETGKADLTQFAANIKLSK